MGQHRRRVHERARLLVQLRSQLQHIPVFGRLVKLLGARTLLETDQAHARHTGQRGEVTQADGAMAVVAVASTALPGDADCEAGHRPQSFTPPAQQARLGRQVGNSRGDVVVGGAEQGGQAQQRTLYGEVGQRLTAGHQAIDPGEAAQQRQQAGAGLDQDDAAPRLHEGSVAEELQGVAQSLFGVEQDGLAVQTRAIPAWLGEGTRREFGGLPAPLVLGPAALVVAGLQIGHGAVGMGLGVAGTQPQGLGKGGLGGVKVGAFAQGDAQVVEGFGVGGVQTQGGAEDVEGLVEQSFLTESEAEVVVGLGIVGLEASFGPVVVEGFGVSLLASADDTEVVLRFAGLGSVGDDGAVGIGGAFEIAGFGEGVGEAVVGIDVVGPLARQGLIRG
jgi:hypothetical protein